MKCECGHERVCHDWFEKACQGDDWNGSKYVSCKCLKFMAKKILKECLFCGRPDDHAHARWEWDDHLPYEVG